MSSEFPFLRPVTAVCGFLITAVACSCAFANDEVRVFESNIRPVLAKHCYKCHSEVAGAAEGGLRLDSRAGLIEGGDRGPAVVAGNAEASWLLRAMTHAEADLKMPPKGGRLPEHVIADFRRWIERGAVDPRRNDPPSKPDPSSHWSYQPVSDPEIPSANDWCRNEIDCFIAAKHHQHGLVPRGDASTETLLRRLHFDLVGLPPSPQEIDRFDSQVQAEGIDLALRDRVDELIRRPEYGERWGRHWLDVARFAESSGKESNISFPYAWRYRDYVINSLNNDVPLDRFLTEQVAGDLLPAENLQERTRLLIATGFLALGPKNLDAANPNQFAADVVDEQIDVVTRVFMASSVACARCHDHKFDPISMEDYYGLAGIFASTKTYFGTAISPANRVGGDPLVLPILDSTPVLHKSVPQSRVQSLRDQHAALLREKEELGRSMTLRDALRIFWRTGSIEGQLEKYDSQGNALPLAMGVVDQEQIDDAPLLIRGEVNRPGKLVPRAFPRAISVREVPEISKQRSGRLALARWLTCGDHPLTSRVAVNRIWSHLFGSGLVDTVDDFGVTGHPPSHPELLDYLAGELVAEGWSQKRLIRKIVLSRAYRQASDYDADSFRIDPENRWLWRMPKRRIEAEAMRDAMLSISGELDLRRPVGSLVGRVIGDRPISLVGLDKRLPRDLDGAVHRSVYLPVMRDRLPDVLDVFDFAEPSLVTGKRESTNVPTQALYMMNSDFVHARAVATAKRIESETDSNRQFATRAFVYCFGRQPRDSEFDRVMTFLESADGDRQSYVSLCQSLFSTAEFRMLD